MSLTKAEKRAKAIDELKAEAKPEAAPPGTIPVLDLIKDMLDSLERIAVALEEIAARPESDIADKT